MQGGSGFLDAQATEEPQLDDLRAPRIKLLQRFQRFVEGTQLRRPLGFGSREFVEADGCGMLPWTDCPPRFVDARARA